MDAATIRKWQENVHRNGVSPFAVPDADLFMDDAGMLPPEILDNIEAKENQLVARIAARRGLALIDRARFERLRKLAQATQDAEHRYETAYLPSPEADEDQAIRFSLRQEKRRQALMALQPGDLDSLS